MKLDQKVAYLAQHNVDSGAFIACPIAQHNAMRATAPMGLHSNNVKRSYNGRKAAKAQLGVTGGYMPMAHLEKQSRPAYGQRAMKRMRKEARAQGLI